MQRIERAIHWIGRQAGWLYVIICLLTISETVIRTVFDAPTIWTLEMSLILAGTAYLLNGASFPQATGHIRIDLVYRRLHGWRRRFADAVCVLVACAYLAVIVKWGAEQALSSWSFSERSGSAWNSPLPIVHKTMIPLAGFLMLVALLCQVVSGLRSGDTPNTDENRPS